MKKHLTDLGVQRIRPPKSGSLQIFDLGYPGLAIRVGHGGAKSFEIFYRENGKLRRDTLGRWPEVSLAAARESWRKTREAIARGDAPPYRAGAKVREREKLFEFVVEEWLRRDQSKNKQSSIYQATRIVEHDLLPAWRGRMVGEISKRDVIALLDAVSDRGAVVKANRVYAHAHRFFRWCVSREIITVSPMNGLEKPGGETSRDRVLSDDELVKVWKGAGAVPYFGSATRLLMLTGARLNEICQLRWEEIEGDCIHLKNGRTKNGQPHLIPLSEPARQVLGSVPRVAGAEFVFTIVGAKPISGWGRAKAKLDSTSGVIDWRIHDLRRTVATGLQKLGITLQVVESVLGHTSGSRGGIVGVYQRHDFAAEKRTALDAWGAHVMALVERELIMQGKQ